MADLRRASLREAVFAGRFVGRASATSELAELVATDDPAKQILLWFGEAWLTGVKRQPDKAAWLRVALDRDIVRLDAMLSSQLDAVMQHPRFTRLEGSWRGLYWLVLRLPPVGGRVRLRLLQARWSEVCRDIERALEFDQSQLFKKIYEEHFGIAGGEPFGLIACDYEIRHRPSAQSPTDDVGALVGLSGIAAASFAPMVFGAAPELLGLSSFADITPSFDPSQALQDADHQRWQQFAGQEDMRFVGIALPRMLGRAPWPFDGTRVDRFCYRNHVPTAAQRVWTSAVYGFAAVAMRAFERFSWPAEVRGAGISQEALGGVLEDLPVERFYSDIAPDRPARAPLEVALTDDQDNLVSQARLMPLSALDGLPEACFGALPSLHRPPRMSSAAAQANQRISTQLNTLLCASRFAHCIKLMGRDMTGSFIDPQDVERRLQKWLSSFISGNAMSSHETTARFPLLDAQVEVRERRGSPGVYNCTVLLKPHHQLDEIGASFKLVTEMDSGRAPA
jgi:type VI secretion system protein ImpD/type VI secretion system protein ImpC